MISQAVAHLTGGVYHDVLCGFRGFSRRALAQILPRLSSRGHGAELETVFLLATQFSDLSVVELPIAATYRGTRDLDELYGQDANDRLIARATMHLNQLEDFASRHGADVMPDGSDYSDRWHSVTGG